MTEPDQEPKPRRSLWEIGGMIFAGVATLLVLWMLLSGGGRDGRANPNPPAQQERTE